MATKKVKKNVKKCMICSFPVDETQDRFDTINGAVVGEYIEIHGHRLCMDNVDRLVVTPNRFRLHFIEDGK